MLRRIWDLILIKGNKSLFRISLAIFHLMEDELLACEGIAQIRDTMDTISVILQDPARMLQVAQMP